MKKLKWISGGLILLFTLNSCIYTDVNHNNDSGGSVEEIFNVDSFDAVDVGSAMNVLIIPGTEFKVTANGRERDVDDLNVRVLNATLKINYLHRNWLGAINRKRMDILIETPVLEAIDASGACRVDIEDFTGFDKLEADVSGASKLNLDAVAEELNITISGASVFTAKKECPYLSADLSGASKLNAFDTNSDEVYLSLSGASRANVSVRDYLKVDASGASTVNYRGTPRIDQDVSGGSKVTED